MPGASPPAPLRLTACDTYSSCHAGAQGLNPRVAAKPIESPFHGQCRQPRRGGTGGDGTIRRKRRRRLRWSSPPGQGEQVPPGVCLSCRLPTLTLVCFFAPIPPTPFPSGEGGDYKFILPGASPPAPLHLTACDTYSSCHAGARRLNPGGTGKGGKPRARRGACPRRRQFGAKPIEPPFYWQCRQPRRGGTGGDGTIRRKRRRRLRWSSPPGQVEQVPPGACLSCRLPTLTLVCFFAPIPPTPFPSGEGGAQGYFMQGAPPLASPGLNPRGTCTTKGFCLFTGGQCRQPRRGGTGGEELRRLRWSSPPGQG